MADRHDVQLRTKLLDKLFPSIDVIDNLDSDNPNRPLSARQGKVLKELIGSGGSTVNIGSNVTIGSTVNIGDNVTIRSNVAIGSTIIEDSTIIRDGVTIGNNVRIESNICITGENTPNNKKINFGISENYFLKFAMSTDATGTIKFANDGIWFYYGDKHLFLAFGT